MPRWLCVCWPRRELFFRGAWGPPVSVAFTLRDVSASHLLTLPSVPFLSVSPFLLRCHLFCFLSPCVDVVQDSVFRPVQSLVISVIGPVSAITSKFSKAWLLSPAPDAFLTASWTDPDYSREIRSPPLSLPRSCGWLLTAIAVFDVLDPSSSSPISPTPVKELTNLLPFSSPPFLPFFSLFSYQVLTAFTSLVELTSGHDPLLSEIALCSIWAWSGSAGGGGLLDPPRGGGSEQCRTCVKGRAGAWHAGGVRNKAGAFASVVTAASMSSSLPFPPSPPV